MFPQLSRVHELRALIADPSAESAYFRQDFDDRLCKSVARREAWIAREREFQCLDDGAWAFLKEEARPYLMQKDKKGRGWQQLFNILNQASAYKFLRQQISCVDVRFVPRDPGMETPDLEGSKAGRTVLCEVKTIAVSEDEIEARCGGTGSYTGPGLGEGFFAKLLSDIAKARNQMDAYGGDSPARKIVYIVVEFDDSLGEYKDAHYLQIDEFLAGRDLAVEIAFFNRQTPFHPQIDMKNAMIINE
jgi:hypothetical protein